MERRWCQSTENERSERFHICNVCSISRTNSCTIIPDQIPSREYLVTKKYISPSKTAILGLSAGAELVAESVERAPSGTFGCAIGDRGAYDSLRVSCTESIDVFFECRFTFCISQYPLFTPGLYWTGIVGDPFNPRDFDFIYPLSSLHNVSPDKILPPTLLIKAGGA